MAAKIIKELNGFSGNKIYLMGKHGNFFVRKIGAIERNLERMQALSQDFPVPKIVKHYKDTIDMEYIHGLDIKSFLKTNHYSSLLLFIINFIEKISSLSIDKDYSEIYRKKLDEVEFGTNFIFTKDQLFNQLPKILPSSNYHGDLTLENIIYTEDKGFFLIDCVTIEYDSYVFDIAKLRQDLELNWFNRNVNQYIGLKTKHIQEEILKKFPIAHNDYLLILMLLRVFRHTKPNTFERNFIVKGINSLWK